MNPLKYLRIIIAVMLLGSGEVCRANSANLVLVTIDGLRWQEVFRGVDERLLQSAEFTKRKAELEARFAAENSQQARAKLLPFLTEQIATQGVLYGNRDAGECMKVANPWHFSYPGYSEILTGIVDPQINSNKKIANTHTTFLEYLHNQPKFQKRVQAFASWDVFPYIINTERSRIPVNAGFMPANAPNKKEAWLNELQQVIPSPWENVRLDAFTHHYALAALTDDKPRVLYIAYGETDDFAHDGHYDQYLFAAARTDQFIAELWHRLQTDSRYRGKTTLLVTTDHGRGERPLDTWQHHGSARAIAEYMQSLKQYENGIAGADDVWFAALGPTIKSGSLPKAVEQCWQSRQVAATALAALGFDWREFNSAMGEPLPIFKK